MSEPVAENEGVLLQQSTPNYRFIPAQPKTTVSMEGKQVPVQAWMLDDRNNVIIALVQEGMYLRTPLAIAETKARAEQDKKK